jgi:hypothetical protein
MQFYTNTRERERDLRHVAGIEGRYRRVNDNNATGYEPPDVCTRSRVKSALSPPAPILDIATPLGLRATSVTVET